MVGKCRRAHLQGDRGGNGDPDHHEQFALGLASIVGDFGHEHELFPEAFGMLAGEFARNCVDVAHTFDGDEERLVGR